MRIWIAAAMLVAGTILIAACEAGRPPASTPPSEVMISDWDGDWTFRFSRSYPPDNQPSKHPPINPPEAIITLSVTIIDGRVSILYAKTADTAGKIWADSVVRPGATVITRRVWQTCDVEQRPFPGTSAQTLVEDVVGSITVPPDAVRMPGGTVEWTRAEGVTEVRIVQNGQHWSDRRIQHYRPDQRKLLYTIDDISAGQSNRNAIELIELADDAYWRNCA